MPDVTAGTICSVLVPTVMDNVTSRLPYKVNMLRDMDIGSAECKDIMYLTREYYNRDKVVGFGRFRHIFPGQKFYQS